MDIQRWTDRETWDAFVAAQPHAPFQQSWAWGGFKARVGTEIVRLAAVSGSRIVGVTLALHEAWRFGQSTLTVFHGPFVDSTLPVGQYQEALAGLLHALAEEAQKRKAVFLHLEPAIELRNEFAVKPLITKQGFRRAPAIQPLDTLVLALAPNEEQLLAAMHEKTRYNLRLAERKGVVVSAASVTQRTEAMETFITLNKQTAVRDRFQSHGPAYYRRLAEYLPPDVLQVYVAHFQGKPVAANLVVRFGDTTTYVHGASGNISRNVMAPHLLQWRQILDAKLAGSQWYDFFGIETPTRPRSSRQGGSWAGITRFKQGFGGQAFSYLPAYELPVKRNWYRLVRAVRFFRH